MLDEDRLQTDTEGFTDITGLAEKFHYTYLLRCADGTIYCGYTTDPRRRAAVHNRGKGAKYTRSRLPVELVYQECFATKSEALKREAALKKLTRAEKIRLLGQG
jgi:putative endonuclease